MSGPFQPIEIPPGVVAKPTKQMRSSNWAEVNLFRWIEGELQPVGGQSRIIWSGTVTGGYGTFDYSDGTYGTPRTPAGITGFASRCKAIHGWYGLDGVHRVCYVCQQNVYVDTGGTLIEITPAGGWPAPPLPASGGYGDLLYGEDLYGTPRASGTINPLDKLPNVWSVDNFGAILLVMNSVDGRLLEWDPAATVGTLLTATANAPAGRCFVVTQERFVMIFGALTADGLGGPRRFAWCDQEARTLWNYSTVTSQAGFLDLEPADPIVCAHTGRFGTLFFTSKKAYLSRYIALPFVFNYSELADDCTPYSPASITSTSTYTVWMSDQGMFAFDGSSISPIPCTIRPWITDDIDQINVREQACIVHVAQFNEVWWFFPQRNQPYNTRAAIFCYRDGWWSQARMSRSAGVTSSYVAHPIMADGTVAYLHEQIQTGAQYAAAENPWAETFDLTLTSGSKLTTIKQIIPDVKGDMPNVQFAFRHRNSRSIGPSGQWTAPILLAKLDPVLVPPGSVNGRGDGYVDVRVTGRDLRMRISTVSSVVQFFTMGANLFDFAIRGDR